MAWEHYKKRKEGSCIIADEKSGELITKMLYEKTTLTLLRLKGVGVASIAVYWRKVKENYPETVLDLHKHLSNKFLPRLKEIPPLKELEDQWNEACRIIDYCDKDNISILGKKNPLPPLLLDIPNPPLLLFVKGESKLLYEHSIAIIGARKPSEYGKKSAEKIAYSLASEWNIVSGLALGCDTFAHRGCLDAGGKTIAVLPGGFNCIHPSNNKKLASEIIETGGCLVSEYLPDEKPTKGTYIKRNRLQSGLSLGVIVIETTINGGTMHTVKFAREQGRKVAALLIELNSPFSEGNLEILSDSEAFSLSDKQGALSFAKELLKSSSN